MEVPHATRMAGQGQDLAEVRAFQWVASNEAILAARNEIGTDQWLDVRYETLVASPVETLGTTPTRPRTSVRRLRPELCGEPRPARDEGRQRPDCREVEAGHRGDRPDPAADPSHERATRVLHAVINQSQASGLTCRPPAIFDSICFGIVRVSRPHGR